MVDYSKIKPTLDAIPTIYGWAKPSTGEILVSIRGGCENPVEDFYPNRPWVEPLITTIPETIEVVEVIEPVVEVKPEPVIEIIPEVIVVPAVVKAETTKPEEFKLPKNIKSSVKG